MSKRFAFFLTGAAVISVFLNCGSVRAETEPPVIEGLQFESSMDLTYAEEFGIYYYDEGYQVIDVKESGSYLLVPEGGTVPENLPEGMRVIYRPVSNIYLAASSAMSLFRAVDGLDSIALSGISEEGWYIEEARKAMEEGSIVFAGKYSQPDYELLISSGCRLAVESTMILHSPKVREMIEMMGIPVFIDYSSYEDHPLGRTEWVKLYGCLLEKEEEAEAFFEGQASVVSEIEEYENTGKTVAFFSINTEGSAVIRTSSDYIPKMIEMGGGVYAFPEAVNKESSRASMTITMEEFYASAVNADYLIYNGTIEEPIETMDDLFALSSLFKDFKAVREDHVWAAGKDLYQATDTAGNLIVDIHRMLTDEEEDQMTFLTKIN